MKKIIFLSTQDISSMHDFAIKTYGGPNGTRDKKLLDSAANQPQMTFSGKYIHKNVFDMAGAYFYHIIKNHAFIDGNKRTSVIALISFLKLNFYKISLTDSELYQLAIDVASSKVSKQELAIIISKNIIKLNTRK